jgi:hypothetical protein
MTTFSYPELAEDLGTATGDGLRNLANTAANALCNAWKDYAAATSGFPDPTGLGAFNNAMLSRLCSPRGIEPPPPEEEFEGGQCPILYSVTYGIGSARPNGPRPTFPPNVTATIGPVLGPIRGGAVLPNPGTRGKRGVIFVQNQPDYPDGIITTWADPNPSDDGRYDGAFSSVLSVVPSDPNQPDVCGDPEPVFPPIVPPIDIFNFPVFVDVGGLNLDLDLEINPTIFSPEFAFKPELNVGIGPFQVVFNPDGVDIFLSPNVDININIPPGLDPRSPQPTPKPPTGGSGGNCPPCICPDVDLQPVLDLLEDIKECTCEEEEFETIEVADSTGDLLTVATWIKSVVINVKEVGEAVRSQLGEGTAPDVLYVGWYAFGRGTALSDRKPLSFGLNVLEDKVLKWSSFAFSLNFNSVADVSITFLKEEE